MDESEEPKLPVTDDQLRAYTTSYFAEYERLGRQMEARDKPTEAAVPSDLIFDLLRDERPEDAWKLIVALVAAAPTDEALGFVGASVLEDLVREYGDRLAEKIIERATVDQRMRDALHSVWGWEEVSESLRTRVRALLG